MGADTNGVTAMTVFFDKGISIPPKRDRAYLLSQDQTQTTFVAAPSVLTPCARDRTLAASVDWVASELPGTTLSHASLQQGRSTCPRLSFGGRACPV
jgi:hypothetical protein